MHPAHLVTRLARQPRFVTRSIFFSLLSLAACASAWWLYQPTQSTQAQAPACTPPPAGMIAWYKGDGNAIDIQSSYNGTIQTGVTFMPGRVGQAFSFDGMGGVTVAHSTALNPAQFTLDAWVNPTQLDGDVEIIVNKENNPFRPGTVQYEMGIRGTAMPGGSIPIGNFCFFIGNITGLPDQYSGWVDGGAAVPLNTWSHVALTFDGTTARTFINGNLIRTVNNLSGTGANSNGPFKIGSRSLSVLNSNPNAPFNGLIDEVELFNRALAPTDVFAIFAAGSAGKCVPAVCGRPNFANRFNFAADTVPSAVAAGDFNGDGKLDLATSNYQANTVSILLNANQGFFAPPVQLPAGVAPQFITVTDLQNDNRLDLVIVNALSDNVAVYTGNGNGTFSAPVTYPVGDDPRCVAAGDLNSDGRPDLAVTNLNTGTISILLNNGAGLLNAAAPLTFAPGIRFVGLADLNADGRTDLAAINQRTNTLSVALGNGNGTFNTPANYGVGTLPQGLTIGDFNSDGYLDIAVANTTTFDISVLLNNGNGTYATGGTFALPTNANPGSIVAGDFNNDGRLDLVTSNYVTDNISVLLGNGAGTFTSVNNFEMGSGPQHLVAGDFNGDGRLDIVTSNLNSGDVSVRYNNCAPLPANTAPTITLAGGGVFLRQQGSAALVSTLATVTDAETIPNNLIVTANAPAGISVSNITNTNGTITASLAASCTVQPGANNVVLTIRDGGMAVTTATFTVNVTANAPPALSAYPAPAAINVGTGTTITPSNPPSDNGTITSLTATATGFAGTLAVNATTGVITVSNARLGGTFGIVVTATDNCGANSTQTVNLTVNRIFTAVALNIASGPYIAGQPVNFTATVTGAAGIVPTGTVTFFDGATALGTATLSASGQAALTTGALVAGNKQLTAVYNGDGTYNAAVSAASVIAVARAAAHVSAANYVGEPLAAEQIATAFGVQMATARVTAQTLPLPTNLAGTIVRVRDSIGAERLAPLLFVSPEQINYVIPAGTANGAAMITIISGDGSQSLANVTIATAAAGIFTANASGSGYASANVLRVLADGTFTYFPIVSLDAATNTVMPIAIDLGSESDQSFLVLYGTGWRNARQATATIGGVSVPVVYLGPQGSFAGLDQANLRIPRSLIGSGDVDVTLTVDGRLANTVRLRIK